MSERTPGHIHVLGRKQALTLDGASNGSQLGGYPYDKVCVYVEDDSNDETKEEIRRIPRS